MFYAFALSLASSSGDDLYELDATWKPQFPVGSHTFSAVGIHDDTVYVTQRGNASIPPVLVLSTKDGALIDMWGAKDVALAHGKTSSTWGAHGLSIESCGYPCVVAEDPKATPRLRVWIEDFTNHTVTAFSSRGQKLLLVGTPGIAGNGTKPCQFDHVADAFVSPGAPVHRPSLAPHKIGDNSPSFSPAYIYASDGDGGSANRVVKIAIPPTYDGSPVEAVWATGHVFDDPHSITLHQASGLLVVADREQQALKLITSTDGTVLGTFDCGLVFGNGAAGGVPFGVRTMTYGGKDLLFVASMDNPQDHMHQQISVLDVSQLTAKDGVKSKCSLVQSIVIDPGQYSGPHLLGVDALTGDVYAALVADQPHGTVLRYRLK